MELKDLVTFQAIVETGSFSAAAKKLNYAQSTITFQVGQLEETLSVRLFERVGRCMTLTAAGRALVPYVEDILRSVNRLHEFEEALADCQGELRIGVAETVLCYKLPPVLKELVRQAPGAKLYLRSMNCYDIRDALMDGTLDVGIFYAEAGGFGSSLTTVPVGSYPVTLAASPETAQRVSDFVSPDRSLPVPLIINEEHCVFRQIFEGYLQERAIRLDHTIQLESIQTIKRLVESDVGVSFLPRFTVEEELSRGSLVELPTAVTHREVTAVCGYHRNKWVSPLMGLFLDLCREEFSSPAAKPLSLS